MKIGSFTNAFQVNNKRNNSQVNNRASYPNLSPLKRDTVSFGRYYSIEDIKNLKPEEIFESIGIDVKKDEQGLLTLSHYSHPELLYDKKRGIYDISEEPKIRYFWPEGFERIKFSNCGIDVNELFKNVKEIKGNAKFEGTEVTSLPNLAKIGGNADFRWTKVESLPKLAEIGGSLDVDKFVKIKSLPNLKKIGEHADLRFSPIEDFPKLEEIGGHGLFDYSKIKSLPNLKTIRLNGNFYGTRIESLPNLTEIGGNADFRMTKIKNLDKIKRIGGIAFFDFSTTKNLHNFAEIKEAASSVKYD